MIKILLLFLLSFHGHANEITIVAVGEAEKDLIEIAFNNSYDKAIKESEKKELKKIEEILKNNFLFYKHLFTIKKSKSAQFQVKLDFYVENNLIFSKIEVKDTKTKSKNLNIKKQVWMNNIRSFTHDISDSIYRSIRGVSSVFKSKIVFVSDRNSIGRKKLIKELYIMDFDGERKQRLTYNQSIVISPAISPDNTKIIFSSIDTRWKKNRHARNSVEKVKNLNLYVYDLITKKTEAVISKKGINSGAIFNKEGDKIYLTLSYQKNADIYRMDLKSKKLTQITTHYNLDVDPHINSDESLLTFLSNRHGRANIYTKDLKGPLQKITRVSYVGDYNAAPRFNPAGDEIVFSSWVDQRFDLYRIGSDGRNLVRLTKDFGSNEEAWYSPDGEFIVFTSQKVISRTRAEQNIYIITRDGELVKKLTNNYGKSYTPRWSN